jgi:hypothetical protein
VYLSGVPVAFRPDGSSHFLASEGLAIGMSVETYSNGV